MAMASYTWQGVTRRGGLRAWVEARYRQGWRHLVLTAADGRETARIGPDGEGRTWYAGRA